MNHWHYQLMYRKYNRPVDGQEGYYAVHEYYETDAGNSCTAGPVTVEGDSVDDVKKMLEYILEDIDKHGVKEYDK